MQGYLFAKPGYESHPEVSTDLVKEVNKSFVS